MSTAARDKLPFLTKVLYGCSDIGFALTDTTIGILFAIFLTDVVGLRPGLAAVAVFLGRTWDYINDPLIGYLSDRTRTRWGRRRPFLLFGFLPFALAFTMMWWRPPIASQVGLAVYYALAYIFYDTFATLVYMPYFALTPELTQDYDERTTLTSYRMVFSILGSLIAFTVPLMIIGTMRPEHTGLVLGVGAGVGLFSAMPLLLTFLGTREKPEYMHQEQAGIRESLRAAARNRPFIFAAGIFLFTWTALEIVQSTLLYFLKYRMNMEKESDIIAATVFIAALLTLPFWERISRRWDKRLAYMAGMLFISAVMIVMIIIDPGWGLPVIFTLAALAGIGVGAMHVLPWAIIPDAIEVDELETGKRHEGTFYSLVTLFRKISSSISIPLILVVLDWTGYVPNSDVQKTSVIRGIQALFGLLPSVILAGGIIFAFFYPLGRMRHAQVRAELAARRAGSSTPPE